MCSSLINKYNIPSPRYTSYPTVPYWDSNTFSIDKYVDALKQSYAESNEIEGLSVYIHLPFCESLCTFCGCHKYITKRHELELPYIESLLKEWKLYVKLLGYKPKIKALHLGGGTPTFFSAKQLHFLISEILCNSELDYDYEFSFEGHPHNTTKLHLQTLFNLGFRRVSFGVQDYSAKVQKAINRVQSFNDVKEVTTLAREIGYSSIGHDIVFGLPYQNEFNVINTIYITETLLPDRIAFYSYAHVPWTKGNGQRGFKIEDIPTSYSKRQQYETGKKLLESIGYTEIGMDHFALKTDSLYTAMQNKSLHRNFMGYTASKTQVMIGLGVSSISDAWYGFAQNVKYINRYYNLLKFEKLPIHKGHILTHEDTIVKQHILNLMCNFETSWFDSKLFFNALPLVLSKIKDFEYDGLLELHPMGVKITNKGKPFVRNICMAFDLLLQRKKPETKLFSMTI